MCLIPDIVHGKAVYTLVSVLGCLAAITKQEFIGNRNLFLIALEAECKIKFMADHCVMRVQDVPLNLYSLDERNIMSSHGRRQKGKRR